MELLILAKGAKPVQVIVPALLQHRCVKILAQPQEYASNVFLTQTALLVQQHNVRVAISVYRAQQTLNAFILPLLLSARTLDQLELVSNALLIQIVLLLRHPNVQEVILVLHVQILPLVHVLLRHQYAVTLQEELVSSVPTTQTALLP